MSPTQFAVLRDLLIDIRDRLPVTEEAPKQETPKPPATPRRGGRKPKPKPAV